VPPENEPRLKLFDWPSFAVCAGPALAVTGAPVTVTVCVPVTELPDASVAV